MLQLCIYTNIRHSYICMIKNRYEWVIYILNFFCCRPAFFDGIQVRADKYLLDIDMYYTGIYDMRICYTFITKYLLCKLF